MRVLLIILVAGCQISFGQDRDAIAFAGCYELQAEGQHTYLSNYGVVPRRLQLTVERDGTSGWFIAKRDSRERAASLRWHLIREGNIEISPRGVWITNGWFIQLNRSFEEVFRGTAQYWTDTGSGRRFDVIGHKVTCRQQQTK